MDTEHIHLLLPPWLQLIMLQPLKIVWPASYHIVPRLMVGLESIWWPIAISLQPQPYEDTCNSHGRPKTRGFLHKTLKTQNNHHLSYFWPRKPFKANSSFPLFSLISIWFWLSNLCLQSLFKLMVVLVQSTFNQPKSFIKEIASFFKECILSLVFELFICCSWSLD